MDFGLGSIKVIFYSLVLVSTRTGDVLGKVRCDWFLWVSFEGSRFLFPTFEWGLGLLTRACPCLSFLSCLYSRVSAGAFFGISWITWAFITRDICLYSGSSEPSPYWLFRNSMFLLTEVTFFWVSKVLLWRKWSVQSRRILSQLNTLAWNNKIWHF